jgi:DHA1 family inner membrane transport protein
MAHALPQSMPAPGPLVLPALGLGSFITMLTLGAPAPFLPDISRDLGVSVSLLGQITAAMLILSAPLGLVAGPLADRYGTRRLILVGLVAAAVCLFTFGLATVFPLLFIASATGALCEATVPGLSLAIAGTRYTGPASRRAIGWIIGALSMAPILGVPILAMIGDGAGWRSGFLIAGGGAIVIVALAAAWLPEDSQRPSETLRWRSLLDAYRPLAHDSVVRRLFACTVTRTICWFGLFSYLGVLLRDRFELTTNQTGMVYMVVGTGYLLGSFIAGGSPIPVPVRAQVAIGNATMALLMLIAFVAPVGAMLAIGLLWIAAFAGAVGWVGLTALITSETPAGAGTTMVLNESLYNAGAAAGVGIGGALLAVGGFGTLALVLALFGFGSGLFVWMRVDTAPRIAMVEQP